MAKVKLDENNDANNSPNILGKLKWVSMIVSSNLINLQSELNNPLKTNDRAEKNK